MSERLDHIVKCIASVCVYQSYTDGSFKRQTMPCRSRRFVTLPRDSLPVHIPSMANRDDQHEENAVLNRVDHPVVTQAHSKPWPPAQRDGRGRSWVLSEKCDRALHATLRHGVQLRKSACGRRPQLDAIAGHTSPRSDLTCSHGMLAPSSRIAESNAAASVESSKAVISSSYRSGLISTAAGRP